MRVALVSTYELGHQPLHVASPAGALTRAGHEVRCIDLSVEPFDRWIVEWADAVACSVPMHTATRLANAFCERVHTLAPDVPLCLYGLYAYLAQESAGAPVDLAISGEYEPRLVAWVEELARASVRSRGEGGSPGDTRSAIAERVSIDLGRGRFGLPARHLLPPLDQYARLSIGGRTHLAGYVEASHGCAHRCRHCPVPVVYDGRTRLVGIDAVLADVAQLVELGARHVTFGDPDFLNGPHHAARVVAAVHDAFPSLTFDVTAKVEHVLAHRDVWPRFADAGCLFVVSAFESTSDTVLRRLAKGHVEADEREAVAVLRQAGIEPRPSLLPFTPWTTPRDMIDLLDLVATCDLVGNVDPVQYAIRLLVPPGSLLLASGALDGELGPYDVEHLSWTWQSGDPRLDELARHLMHLAERAGAEEWPARTAYDAIRAETLDALDRTPSAPPAVDPRMRSPVPPDERPRLTEAWFCCAEPTSTQLQATEALDTVAVSAT